MSLENITWWHPPNWQQRFSLHPAQWKLFDAQISQIVHLVHIPNYIANWKLYGALGTYSKLYGALDAYGKLYCACGAHGANYMAWISLFWKFPRIFATVLWLNRKYYLAPWEIQLMHRIRQITLIAVQQQCISVQSTGAAPKFNFDQIYPGLLASNIQTWSNL